MHIVESRTSADFEEVRCEKLPSPFTPQLLCTNVFYLYIAAEQANLIERVWSSGL